MAKQQGCFAAQQSCAAKSFFAFRHYIIIIRLAEEHLPGLSEHIAAKKIVTAEDYRRLTHMKKSSFGGAVPIWKQRNPPYLTPVKDLIFVGAQSESGGGVPIVLLGAVEAYEKASLANRAEEKHSAAGPV